MLKLADCFDLNLSDTFWQLIFASLKDTMPAPAVWRTLSGLRTIRSESRRDGRGL